MLHMYIYIVRVHDRICKKDLICASDFPTFKRHNSFVSRLDEFLFHISTMIGKSSYQISKL